MRDYQKSLAYKWEDVILENIREDVIDFSSICEYVNSIWLNQGLEYPPIVEVINPNVKKYIALGGRNKLQFGKEGAKPSVILHEISHAMTNDKHGPNWVGVYMNLLNKYNIVSLLISMHIANKMKLDFNINAQYEEPVSL